MSGASGVNLPLLVAGVFAATFLVVCALAYVFLGRSQSGVSGAGPLARPVPAPPRDDLRDAPAVPATIEASGSPAVSIGTITRTPPAARTASELSTAVADASPARSIDPGRLTILRLYRLLMFLTGGTGLVASYLMFTAVEGFSRLLVIALVVFGLSAAALYRGFVPDPELTGRK